MSPRKMSTRRSAVRDRVVELVRVPAGELSPHPANFRRHPERQRAALRALLRQIGYADALLARRDGDRLVLIDGHLRQSLDPEQVVPVLVLDVDETEAETLLATLDPLGALATPDPAALASLLERVQTSSRAVSELLEALARQAGLPRRIVGGDVEHVGPLPATPVSQPGDLWVLGEHRLLCGDATNEADLDRLMDGKRADLLWTDPPYGVDYVGKTKEALRFSGDDADGVEQLLAASLQNAGRHLAEGAPIYLCHPAGALSVVFLQAFVSPGWRLHQTLVWVKDRMVLGHADYHYRHEPIAFGYAPGGGRRGRGSKGWYGDNAQDSVLEVPRPAASPEHPTAKPVELVLRCLANSSADGDGVLDVFAGSGSTLVACEVLGRRGFALELDPRYCDVVVARWEELTGGTAERVGTQPS